MLVFGVSPVVVVALVELAAVVLLIGTLLGSAGIRALVFTVPLLDNYVKSGIRGLGSLVVGPGVVVAAPRIVDSTVPLVVNVLAAISAREPPSPSTPAPPARMSVVVVASFVVSALVA